MSEQEPFAGTEATERAADQPVATMSFEAALAELERIVQELEQGQLDLDRSIRAYERGTELRRHCEAKLTEAELRVERISLDRGGEARTEPFETP